MVKCRHPHADLLPGGSAHLGLGLDHRLPHRLQDVRPQEPLRNPLVELDGLLLKLSQFPDLVRDVVSRPLVNLIQPFQLGDLLFLGAVHGVVEIHPYPDRRHEAGCRPVKVWLLPIQTLLQPGRARHQVHLQRTVGYLADGQANDLAECVADLLQFGDIDSVLVNLHPNKRVEVLDRHAEFLGEELRQVRHDGRATVQEHPHRVATALLLLPELQRLVDLHMKAGQHLAGNLGECSLVRIIRLGIRATQADQPLLQLDLLRLREAHLRLRRKLLRDRVGSDVNGANEKFLALEKQRVGRLGTDVQHQRATLDVVVVVPEGVDQRSLRCVDQFHVRPLRLGYLDHPIRHFALQCGEQHLDLPRLGHPHRVMVPRGLLQRERDVLLRLELDQLGDLGLVDRRESDRLGQHLEPGCRHQAALGREVGLLPQLLRRLLQRLGPCPLAGALQPHRLDAKTEQTYAALRRRLELGGTQRAGTHVNCQKGLGTHFNSADWTANQAHSFNNSQPRQRIHFRKSGRAC